MLSLPYCRSTYMGERRRYYDRRLEGVSYPKLYLSTIGDGMAQAHNELPYQANLSSFGDKKLDCHLQGTIVHGRWFTIIRTFVNVRHNKNLAIHSSLYELETIFNETGSLPPTLYHQVDGGSENYNDGFLAICELLIHRGLTTKVVLTRLVKGHTHEDIDSMFGVIWTRFRGEHLLTPQSAKALFESVYKHHCASVPAKVSFYPPPPTITTICPRSSSYLPI